VHEIQAGSLCAVPIAQALSRRECKPSPLGFSRSLTSVSLSGRAVAHARGAVIQHASNLSSHRTAAHTLSASSRTALLGVRERFALGAQRGARRGLSMSEVIPKKGTVTVTVIDPVTAKDGREIQARIGASVLDVVQEHDMVRLLQRMHAHLVHSGQAPGAGPRCSRLAA
jgi:hypothetical protein